ncbi:MAG: aminodeoxychorismate/anthranilate synthase component II [Candidatus Thermoplasmatota archaeon]|nr:aminodeoxychorismate/anthranilate synthase component II [Candidatus Thermoplasmatota archaeon]
MQLIESLGGNVEVVQNDSVKKNSAEGCDGVVISPGPGNPTNPGDRGTVLELLNAAHLPVLGICFGHQLLAYYLNCAIKPTKIPMHGEVDRIKNFRRGILRNVPEIFRAIRYHSLVVEPNKGISVDAVSESDGTVMAFHALHKSIFGVQFHPESYYSEFGQEIIRTFLEML